MVVDDDGGNVTGCSLIIPNIFINQFVGMIFTCLIINKSASTILFNYLLPRDHALLMIYGIVIHEICKFKYICNVNYWVQTRVCAWTWEFQFSSYFIILFIICLVFS